ncbi:hypothetical protein ANCDUO_05650 [Ancylostoma duodenale]|uniref:Collagen triple helix repeat protein n=1 Tax=Ancylostoma duodenale TaxID=51022 RepID=A0A0C2DN15_9BILA|nr:hypothetical protein ANCDUO_05650 [Ancylostoma duodenale]
MASTSRIHLIAAGPPSTSSSPSGSLPNMSRRHTVIGATALQASNQAIPSLGFLTNDDALSNLAKFLSYYGETVSEMKTTLRIRQREWDKYSEKIEALERQIDQLRCGYEYDSLRRFSSPSGPLSPCGPGAPALPGLPGRPSGPGGPCGPGSPGGPGSPAGDGIVRTCPGCPGDPGCPSAPGFPGGPCGPGGPRNPGRPGGPCSPGAPGIPSGPFIPGGPGGPGGDGSHSKQKSSGLGLMSPEGASAPGAPGLPGTPSFPGEPSFPGGPGGPGGPVPHEQHVLAARLLRLAMAAWRTDASWNNKDIDRNFKDKIQGKG